MRFDAERSTLRMMASEFVATARRGASDSVALEENEPEMHAADLYLRQKYLGDGSRRERIILSTVLLDYPTEILCDADKIEGDTLTFLCLTDAEPTHPRKEWLAQVRGEGYLAGLGFARSQGISALTLRFLIVNPERDEMHPLEEYLSEKKLTLFFEKCKKATSAFARAAVHRATVRIPSMKNARFPFPNMREGQDEFIHAVYRTVKNGSLLFSEAPTGIGKTVSALYPAIRAMGAGYGEKIFYLTPKTTTATVARDTVAALSNSGVCLRAVILTAKDKICFLHNICRTDKDKCPYLKNNRLTEAALALFDEEIACVTREDIERLAKKFEVCPYELSLTYSELCDLVICDFNYLFDMRAYLRRYFEFPGDYIFLIDEAHNLPDRAREMYSAELYERDLIFEGYPLGEHSILAATLAELTPSLWENLFAYLKSEIRTDKEGRQSATTHMRSLPEGLVYSLGRIVESAEKEIVATFRYRGEDRASRLKALYAFYYQVKKVYDIAYLFDEHYEFFLFFENNTLHFKLFCIDPSAKIQERTALGRATVFFSATMSPLIYTRTLLSDGREGEALTLDSPFDKGQLSIAIMDSISTRTSERERTLPAVLRAIAATVSARRGNYMVFAPSYEYTARLAAAFREKYPKIRTMVQRQGMSEDEKRAFMDAFAEQDPNYLVAFCVTGGIFSEGIDLWGERLIGAIVVGVTLPSLSFEREAMQAYYEEKFESGKQYAYVYPGFNKVLQAAGRVIRREGDRGVIVLIDDRFSDPVYKKGIPSLWRGLKFVSDPKALRALFDRFWAEE